MKIAVAGTGYVGLSLAVLLAQHNDVTAVDIVEEKVNLINKRISPIRDEYIEKYFETNPDDYARDNYFSKVSAELNPGNYFYLYSKYLKDSYRCGMITDELKKAVLKDLENQTANDIFFHKPEDELGVISFGIGDNFIDDMPENYYYNEYGDLIDRYTCEIVNDNTLQTEQAKESMKLTDLTIGAMDNTSKSFVITQNKCRYAAAFLGRI